MKRYPKAFTKYWNEENEGYCGILEEDDFKHEACLAWKDGRRNPENVLAKILLVKHRPSGKYLPPVKSYHSTTSRELSNTPRIFYRRQDAESAAKWWAAGMAGTIYDNDYETGIRMAAGVVSEPVEGRSLKDLIICQASLTILTPTTT